VAEVAPRAVTAATISVRAIGLNRGTA
jgi:hypothetical protein